MSLLLEALKKAEKAKEEAQRRAGQRPAPVEAPLRLGGEPPADEQAHHVLTRDHLPDISQPLEILSDDLERPAQARAGAPAAAQADTAAARPAPHAARSAPAASQPAAQAAARRVFETKHREPNPKLPFHITLAVLGVAAVGTVGYFWYQLRPAPSLVVANPPHAAEERPVAVAPAPPRTPDVPPAAQAPVAVPPKVQASAPAARAPARRAGTRAAAPRDAGGTRSAAAPPAAPPAPGPSVAVTRAAPIVHPQVAAGYAAYRAGDFSAAREAYRLALRDEPDNRDALLGLAAVEVRSQRPELAEPLYERVLQLDPRDAHAQAGLLNLRGTLADPVTAESRLKSLIAADTQAHVLYYALGNQFARQERWPDAQQAYTRALAADPENADFTYNLAVSLDRQRRSKLALEYYRRALALAATRGAAFDRDAAERRARELAQ